MKSNNPVVTSIVTACVYVVEAFFLTGFILLTLLIASRFVERDQALAFSLGFSVLFGLWLHRVMNVLRKWDHGSLADLTDQMERATMTVNYYERTRKLKAKLETRDEKES